MAQPFDPYTPFHVPSVVVSYFANTAVAGVKTVTETSIDCLMLPLVPAMVSMKAPPAIPTGTLTVRVVEPDPITEAGFNVAVTPAGCPLTVKLTVPVKPLVGFTVTV